MKLPIRILGSAPDYPAVVVDGAFEGAPAPRLHLSHWPGNHTPAALRHDLSSGSALAFSKLPEGEQRTLAGNAEAWVNSHYDTDGCLALFCLVEPELADRHNQLILDAAAAGDFFRWPNDLALSIDAIVMGLSHSADSPLAERLAGMPDLERWQTCCEHLMHALPDLLRGRIAAYAKLWEPVLERAKQDALGLSHQNSSQVPELSLQVWSGTTPEFLPGRHPIFQATSMDRALVASELSGGLRVRLIESTLTWFDLASGARSARPALDLLAHALNECEGLNPNAKNAWRAQPRENASPELWFGQAGQAAFAEHNERLGLSSLSLRQVLGQIQQNWDAAIS